MSGSSLPRGVLPVAGERGSGRPGGLHASSGHVARRAALLLTSLPVGAIGAGVAGGLVVGGSVLSVVAVGVPLVLAGLLVARWLARLERIRLRLLLGIEIESPYRSSAGRGSRLAAVVGDPASWRDLLYLALLLPIGAVQLVVGGVAVGVPLVMATLWTWSWALPEGEVAIADLSLESWPRLGLTAALALPAAALAAPLILLVAAPHGPLARGLLAPSRATLLARRVDELMASRASALAAQAVELRRIERNLHDGAQASLVKLSLDLGTAAAALPGDPRRAADLLRVAQDDVDRVLDELRDLARGFAPPILADRGLDAALSALTPRCPVPVDVRVELARRPPAPVETAAYFVVAEALANVAKHAAAGRADVRVTARGELVVVEVTDDGRGGADSRAGRGLSGLADRVAALDGCLTVDSPAGGPTRIVAELPCAS